MYLKLKNRTFLLLLAAVLVCFLIVLNQSAVQLDEFYEGDDGILPVVDESFSPSGRSIYFHETSSVGGLDSRQACAVEAAARAHPQWDVHVLILAPVASANQTTFSALRTYRNVHMHKINIRTYAQGTPLYDLVVSGKLSESKWKISHTSDVLRYLTLYKYGGIYLDLDTVVMKNLEPLGDNWAAREDNESVAAGALAFSRDAVGRTVAQAAAHNIATDFRGYDWGYNGPGVITRVLQTMCHTKQVKDITSENCNGFKVYGPEVVYPIHWTEANRYFEPQSEQYPDTYIHHVWNQKTKHRVVPRGSLYDQLASRYCPNVYRAYNHTFGL